MNHSLTVIVLAALLLPLDLHARETDAPPTRPEGARAVLYDGAGGELFWQRSTDDQGAVRGYEITRNGQSLGILDALSYYDPTLRSNTSYTFTIAAIDSAGQRSPIATAVLGPVAGGAAPTTPATLRAERYSSSAIELFWRREPAPPTQVYEIRRDGEIVAVTDGTSYFTNALRSDTRYVFSVVARDTAGRRSPPARIDVWTPTSNSSASIEAGQPRAPERLRAQIYSRTAAELFWQRTPSDRRLRHEVRRNGNVIATTRGTSFFTDDLDAGISYTFEVRAVAPDGTRSLPARTTFSIPENVPPSLPPAPAGLRSSVYSRTAAELFWERASRAGLRYEVRRDGVLLATTDGTSYFDDGLSAGRTYAYEIITLDADGRFSPSASITLGTEGNRHEGAADAADRARFLGRAWRDVVTEALAALDGEPLRQAEARVRDIAVLELGASVPEPVLQLLTESGATDEIIPCPGGGSLRSRRSVFIDLRSGNDDIDRYTFDDCVLDDGTRVEGEAAFGYDQNIFRTGNSERFSSSLDGFTLDASDEESSFQVEVGSRSFDSIMTVARECPSDGPDVSNSAKAVGRLPIGTAGTVLERLDTRYTGDYRSFGDDAFGQQICALVETLTGSAELRLADDRVLLVERRVADLSFETDALDARLTLRLLPNAGSLTVSPVDGGEPNAVRVEINENGMNTLFQTTLDGWLEP